MPCLVHEALLQQGHHSTAPDMSALAQEPHPARGEVSGQRLLVVCEDLGPGGEVWPAHPQAAGGHTVVECGLVEPHEGVCLVPVCTVYCTVL